jgi:transcriptional regulator with XRE-family HTH domain
VPALAIASPSQAPEFQNLGRHLLAARSRRGLTQHQVAERCGLDQAHISKFEKGHRWPTLAQLIRLAKVLEVPLQWFLNGHYEPGTDWRELALELYHLGIVDLLIEDPVVPGAFRPPEQVLALALIGDQPHPRVVEALPAVLAWNPWNPRLLEAYGYTYDARVAHRLAWLADLTLTIHQHRGFPGGCSDPVHLADFRKRIAPPQEADSLGYPGDDHHLPPVSKRWKITYAADLATFRNRAEHLNSLRVHQQSPPVRPRIPGYA